MVHSGIWSEWNTHYDDELWCDVSDIQMWPLLLLDVDENDFENWFHSFGIPHTVISDLLNIEMLEKATKIWNKENNTSLVMVTTYNIPSYVQRWEWEKAIWINYLSGYCYKFCCYCCNQRKTYIQTNTYKHWDIPSFFVIDNSFSIIQYYKIIISRKVLYLSSKRTVPLRPIPIHQAVLPTIWSSSQSHTLMAGHSQVGIEQYKDTKWLFWLMANGRWTMITSFAFGNDLNIGFYCLIVRPMLTIFSHHRDLMLKTESNELEWNQSKFYSSPSGCELRLGLWGR